MAISDQGKIVAAGDGRGLRVFNRKQPLRRWISAEKWINLEENR